MAGNVYLRTNRFEVKLEAITFKTRDFEYLCRLDFLFPQGRVWDRPPIVGLDIMRHPRDPSILLVLLCFGVGCVILRFVAGEPMPTTIRKFLSDKRIHFVGFGIPEKKDLFPFEEFGLTKHKVDIGYLAAKVLKEPKCKTWELAELARKVLGIKKMIGLTEASSFERHEQIKCAICQLFITSVIAMGLLRTNEKKLDVSHKKSTFLKNLNSLHLLAEGWFKLPKGKKKDEMIQVEEEEDSVHVHIGEMEDMFGDDLVAASPFGDSLLNAKTHGGDFGDDYFSDSELEEVSSGEKFGHFPGVNEGDSSDSFGTEGTSSDDNSAKAVPRTTKMPLKGILKCPSTGFSNYKLSSSESDSPTPKDDQTGFLGRIAAIEAIVSIQARQTERMMFRKEYLDLILVPCGLIIMFSYHLILLYRCLKLPHTTVIGFENNDKKTWVEKLMQKPGRENRPGCDIGEHLSGDILSLGVSNSKRVDRSVDRQQFQHFPERVDLRGHSPSNHVHQVHHPPHLLPPRIFVLRPVLQVLHPRQLPNQHPRQRHLHGVRGIGSHSRRRLLVRRDESTVLCYNVVAVVFRSDTDVRDVGDNGGAPPLFGQRHHFAEEDSIPR
ncbi:UNVERIFIED_CONTAM: hypothetical protein Scaly_2320200 [Sesamum calycinum]|uniref:Uncharacterized protein n=1 Tax=Sesamum calycinum TaxID=2727403 RepID=A0AAW2MCP9_9LAMI